MSDDVKVKIDDEKVSLADLGGLSMDDIQELRSSSFPRGLFLWEFGSGDDVAKLSAIGEGDDAKPASVFRLKCLEVVDIKDDDFTNPADSLLGKFHQETFFLSNSEGLGYMKAFIKDTGAPYASKLNDLLAGTAGTRFYAPIGKRRDKNDKDKVYTNIVRDKIKPAGGASVSEVAKQVA